MYVAFGKTLMGRFVSSYTWPENLWLREYFCCFFVIAKKSCMERSHSNNALIMKDNDMHLFPIEYAAKLACLENINPFISIINKHPDICILRGVRYNSPPAVRHTSFKFVLAELGVAARRRLHKMAVLGASNKKAPNSHYNLQQAATSEQNSLQRAEGT
jgi:hypothetical protein